MRIPDEIVDIGGDLTPDRLLDGYRAGTFPMHLSVRDGRPLLCWWAPDPRAVVRVDDLRVSRSLKRAAERYEVRIDTAFADVVRGCADPSRPHGWINAEILHAYTALHHAGHAHSFEAWRDGELCGGLYGVAIGGLFAGESMFHRRRDASKAAFHGLCMHLRSKGPGRLIDCQWQTDHLRSLGAVEIPAAVYRTELAVALELAPAFSVAGA